MAWARPEFDRQTVNKAGKALVDPQVTDQELYHALEVINNWRAAHSFPLNTLQMGLRTKARSIDPRAIIAQRTKRLSSVALKLNLHSGMRLSQMQDIGGCRAILLGMTQVSELEQKFSSARSNHQLANVDDYIHAPKASGYRGIHLNYKYFSDRNSTYNELKIEVQLRSRFQHAWATSVETVGTFTDQKPKSGLGSPDWLRFFALMGAAISMRERTGLDPFPRTVTG